MDTMILQVPVERAVKLSAQRVTHSMGFSSLQDFVRLILAKVAGGQLAVSVTETFSDEILTPAQEKKLTRDYLQARKEIDAGKGYSVTSVEEMMKVLRS